jgi:hypothetical protein
MAWEHCEMRDANLRLEIVEFVDDCQPGVVLCQFRDAAGQVHSIVDKVPMFTCEDLWSDSTYPQVGAARCEVLKRFRDIDGLEKALVTIDRPDGLEATSGSTEFLVLNSSLEDRAISN